MIRLLAFILLLSTLVLSTPAFSQPAVIDVSDYDNIHDAAAAIPEAGGVLKLPPGEVKIDKPIRITTEDTRIEGSGSSSHIVNDNQEGQPAILIANPAYAGKATPGKDRLWRVELANFRVTGNPQSGSGIEARYVEEIFVRGVTSSDHGGDGLHLHFCYEDPRISDSLFTYNKGCGLFLKGCHDIIVSANQFEENQDALRCIDSFNLTMTGNNLDDHLGDGVVIENTYGSVVSGNMIEECQGWAVVLDRDCYGITLSSNVIAHEFSGGIDLRDAHGCAVSANTFTIVKQVALAIRKDSGSITVSANNFSDSRIGTAEDGAAITKRGTEATRLEANPNEATGILLESCEAVVISGNLFSGLQGKSIRQEGDCRQVLLNGNVQRSSP